MGHFALGAFLGTLVDAKVVGPITQQERKNHWLLFAKLALQLMLFGLLRHYVWMIIDRVPVGSPHVIKYEGGWALAIGIITSHQNLFARVQLLTEEWST